MFPRPDQNDEEAHDEPVQDEEAPDAAAWMEHDWMRFFATLRMTAAQALRARGIF